MKIRYVGPMIRSVFIASIAFCVAACASRVAAPVVPMPSTPLDATAPITRIAFGSCLKQAEPMPILATIAAREPDLMVLLGDNVYGDVETVSDPDMPELRRAYNRLASRSEFAALRRSVPLLTVWDDHDYGLNDQGGDFPLKEEAEAIFEDAWALPEDDARRTRPGVYGAWTYGPEGRRVQVVLLDTRFFRDPLTPTDQPDAPMKERYIPDPDPDAQILGEAQEAWLRDVLSDPAELRVVVSSIQVLAEGHGWEGWRLLPAARDRFLSIIAAAEGETVLVSGDRHAGGLYALDEEGLPQLFEMTASSLNAPMSLWRGDRTDHEPGPRRLGDPVYAENFGEITVDWEEGFVTMQLLGLDGSVERKLAWPMGRGVNLLSAAP